MLLRILTIALAVWLTSFSAYADEPNCRLIGRGPTGAEWMDGETPRGVRYVNWDPNWERLQALDGMYLVGCKACRAGQGFNAVFWIVVDDPDKRNLTELVSRDHVAAAWTKLRSPERLQLQSDGEVVPISLFGLDGVARVLAANVGGHAVGLMAVAGARGCLGFFGLAVLPAAAGLSLEDFRPFTTSMSLQWYLPSRTPRLLGPLPPLGRNCDFPLGDARLRCQEQR